MTHSLSLNPNFYEVSEPEPLRLGFSRAAPRRGRRRLSWAVSASEPPKETLRVGSWGASRGVGALRVGSRETLRVGSDSGFGIQNDDPFVTPE